MNTTSGFYNLGIAPNILGILDGMGFTVPTPIQEKSIPPAIEGKDMIGIAQTGTGKTLAFGIPLLQAAQHGKRSLIVLPTRELALQVNEVLQKIGARINVRIAVVIGGESIVRQMQKIRSNPQIIIGTPGRIVDHLQRRSLTLTAVSALVLDEADRMLEMGFAPQLNVILSAVNRTRQMLLFSATMPRDIVAIAEANMKLPLHIEIAPSGTTVANITQELFFVQKSDKPRLLEKVLYEYGGPVLIFSRTKFGAKRIATTVRSMGHTAVELHSNRSLRQRIEALQGFKDGRYRILVATDIAARGIDVKGIELVLNFDLPNSAEDYVHRIGRTARAGGTGHAISFATPQEKNDVRGIERLIRATLPLSKLPELPPFRKSDRIPEADENRFRKSYPRSGGGRRGYGTSRFQRGPRRNFR